VTLLLLLPGETETTPAWRPTVSQVAALLRARTRGPASRDATVAGEQDQFTTTTRPTYAQVEEIIGIATGEMFGMTESRTPCSDVLAASFRAAALYRACMLVETSYKPENNESDATAFKAFEKMWESSSVSAAAAINRLCPLTSGGQDFDGEPAGRVPCRIPTTWQTLS
jgi:hypothetical protein